MFSNQAILNLMEELRGGSGHKLYLTYRLAKNDDWTDDAALLLADLDEADFDGYAAIAIANNAPFINGSGVGELDGLTLTWTAGSGITSQVLYGIYVTYTGYDGNPKLFFAAKFDTPTTLSIPSQKLKKRVNFFVEDDT